MARKKKKRRNPVIIILKALLLILLVVILGGLCFFYFGGYYDQVAAMKTEADELVSASTKETFVPTQTGEIYDADGNLISETVADKDATYLTIDKIPQTFIDAFTSVEDKNFYRHGGVDYKAIFRAAWEAVRNKEITQGGSTITMQLARGVFLSNERTWQRKVEEIFISWDLEKKYTKDEIMEFYLNNIYFANGHYGIEAASEGYFSVDPDALDLSEVAFLTAIPNSPTYYDPITNADHTVERRDLILENMLEDGKITQDEYNAATSETITLKVSSGNSEALLANNAVLTYTYKCATEVLMQEEGFVLRYDFASDEDRAAYEESYNSKYDDCEDELYRGGYKIYTSWDMDKQAQLQDCVDDVLSVFTDTDEEGQYEMQGAAVCIDNSTGMVIAMVGGRTQEESASLTLNRAFQSYRQPGSSIKPLAVYTPAFEHGYYPNTIVEDKKIEDGPSNAGGGYRGKMKLSEAVQRSLNTVAWQVYEDITPQVGLFYLKKMDFSMIVDADYTLATALGGFTYGVEPVEMASGYATLENDGKFRTPSCITEIEDYAGNPIYQNDHAQTEVYEENAAREMVSVLEGVLEESWGTGRGLQLDNDMPAAGKTGTTDEAKDGWFCGFTHYYTTAVWVGMDTPESVYSLQGASYPGSIWQQYMNLIHEGLTPVAFEEYDHDEEDEALEDQDDDDDKKKKKKKHSDTDSSSETVTTEEEDTVDTQTIDTWETPPSQSNDTSNSSNAGGNQGSQATDYGGNDGGSSESGGSGDDGGDSGGDSGGSQDSGGGSGGSSGSDGGSENTESGE